MNISAVLDELSMEPLAAGRQKLEAAFSALIGLIDVMRRDGVAFYARSNLWEAKVSKSETLLDLATTAGLLDEDLQSTLIQKIDGLTIWDSSQETFTSRQHVANQIKRKQAYACVVLPDRKGQAQVNGTRIYLIGDSAGAIFFYRQEPEICDFSQAAFMAAAVELYPNLYFAGNIANQIRKFSRQYRSMRSALITALSDLNDRLPGILKELSEPARIQTAFNASSAFRISPESAKTRRNEKVMKQRDVQFGAEKIRCEWHLKFSPTSDRIHFYFGKQKVAPGRILIGLFCDHLPI